MVNSKVVNSKVVNAKVGITQAYMNSALYLRNAQQHDLPKAKVFNSKSPHHDHPSHWHALTEGPGQGDSDTEGPEGHQSESAGESRPSSQVAARRGTGVRVTA